MKHTQISLTLILVAVIMAACAPQANTATPNLVQESLEPESTPVAPTETLTPAQPVQPEPPTPQPVATSRGSQLVATDPSLVNLASGKPVLLEFFRFT